jgi:hypothetical protein
MGKKIEYSPHALLFRWNYREDDGAVRLVGTDPELKDAARFFRWIDEPGGWDRREPWVQATANATQVEHKVGFASGWPGAQPISRPLGRPRKDVAEDDRPVSVSTSLRRAELFEIQRLAADARQSVSEWVASALRARLGEPAANSEMRG